MTSGHVRLDVYLGHILEAIDRIERYTTGIDESAFFRNELVQDAVLRNIEILGEASNNIEKHYPEFSAAHPDLPLALAYQMRNAVIHGYFTVDLQVVWNTIRNDLPDLRTRTQQALASTRAPRP